jgi:hypothetical protein
MNRVQDTLQKIINTSDVSRYAKQYQASNMLLIEDFLPRDFVIEHLVPEVEHCKSYIHRVFVPGFKKSGSVSYQHLENYAPQLFQIYNLPAMKGFIENIVGNKLYCCPPSDQHAAALYYYTEPGDHIGIHYDKSFYKGKRFTVLIGMIQDSEHSKLVCYPDGKKKPPLTVATHPGTLVLFNGNVLWHKVSPLAENECRAILTLEYVTNTQMTFLNRHISNFKDRFLYFGKSEYQNA